MFWGITIDNGKHYTQTVEESFHISMAALETMDEKDVNKLDSPLVSIMVKHEKAEFLICTLEYGKLVQQPLNLNFTEGEEVTFFIEGTGVVHLTGYEVPENKEVDFPNLDEVDMTSGSSSESTASESEEEVEDNDEDDGDNKEVPTLQQLALTVNGMNGNEEESEEEEWKPGKRKKRNKKKHSTNDEDQKPKRKKVSGSDEDADEDSDDEDYIPNDEEDEKSDDTSDDSDDLSDDDYNLALIKKKKNKIAKKQKDESSDDSEDEEDYEVDDGTDEDSDDDEEEEEEEDDDDDDDDEENTSTEKMVVSSGEKKKKSRPRKKARAKNKKADTTSSGDASSNIETPPKSNTKTKTQLQKKLKGGTVIKDIKEGSGKLAKLGKMVSLYYTGKLSKNNKQFDSCQSGKAFTFRLGQGEVIKGWDLGVQGMKVGGKRSINIPPSQGYGGKKMGSIPANSNLSFEVELKSVR